MPMSNSTARKRHNPEPLPHWDPAVRALIDAAYNAGLDQGRIEGHEATVNAMREDEREGRVVEPLARLAAQIREDDRRAAEVES